jgi:hypothetical protein
MLMARETSTLKKGAGSVSYRMLMGDDGKGLAGIYRYTMFLLIELRDSAFSKGERLHM